MTREETITVFKAFMDNPLFSDVHKAAFSIAIHDIKQRHEWDINKLMLVPKSECEQEPTTKNDKIDCQHTDCNNCVNHKYCDYESTTKDDLALDAISREKAIAWAEFYTNVYDAETANESIMIMLKGLLPVTLQESIKPVLEDIKAEINRKANSGQWSDATVYGMQKAIAIIDKHISGK